MQAQDQMGDPIRTFGTVNDNQQLLDCSGANQPLGVCLLQNYLYSIYEICFQNENL